MRLDRFPRTVDMVEFRRLRCGAVARAALMAVFLIAATPLSTPAEVTGRGVVSPAGGTETLRSQLFSLTATAEEVERNAVADLPRLGRGGSADGLAVRHVVVGARESVAARGSGGDCLCGGHLFSDGFESGGTANWSSATD